MARLYRIDNGEPMTGEALVEKAIELFRKDRFNYQRKCEYYPRTISGVKWFLAKYGKKVYTKKDRDKEWAVMEN
jgi:hypothetical protein